MLNILDNLYISFYLYSRKMNGEKTFHNFYSCLALTFLELMVFSNVSVLLFLVSGISLADTGIIDGKVLPMSILACVFFANYAFFTSNSRFKRLVDAVDDKNSDHLRLYGLKVFIVSCATFLFLSLFLT